MRLSEFRRAVTEEFGAAYGATLARDLVLPEMDDRTAEDALAAGIDPREVWLALCRASGVPESRWHGVGLMRPPA